MRSLFLLLALSCLLVSSFALASEAQQQPSAEKEWTLLVYINGNNNLDSYGAMDINEMEAVGSNSKINVVVQWASMATTTKRLLVKKDNDVNTVTSPILEDLGNVDMGDYRTLIDFIRWGVAKYPAKKYFIDVWNHGSGWHMQLKNQLVAAGQAKATDISWDEKSGNHITTEQLGQAMAEAAKIIGHKVDLYGSDACLMGMAEVAAEMSESVETYVGSEETEALKGWPYDTLLQGWNALPNATSQEVAKVLVREYVKSYQGGSQGTESSATMSAYDMSKLGGLNTAVKAFGDRIKKLDKAARQKLVSSAESSQKFAYSDYVDVLDFLDQSSKARIEGLEDTTRGLREAAKTFIIANAATEAYAKAQGLAMWLPTDSYSFDGYSSRYKALRFNAATGWGEALQALLAP
ncbi:MAG: hypothetical protein HY075_04025 [Deltaproteobacteria bacterium]|nr:hypothetical protein [Deltaproteobacteria bacterium]